MQDGKTVMAEQRPFEQLPFSEERQSAVLGHLLKNDNFFKISVGRIKPEWFSGEFGESRSLVWAAKVDFWKRYGRAPASEQEFLESEKFRAANQGVRNRMNVAVKSALEASNIYPLDAITPELTSWLHARLFFEGFVTSEKLFNSGKMNEAYLTMEGKIKDIRTTDFSGNNAYDFKNWRSKVKVRKLQFQNALSIGNSVFDNLLLPINKGKGSLLPGDTTIFLAPSNVGKSTVLITIIAHNLKLGKHVLYLSHEGVDDDLVEKLLCCMLGVDRAKLFELEASEDPQIVALIDTLTEFVDKNLVYVPLNRAGLTVEEVASVIRQKQEERMSANFGTGFDLLADDYPAKLISENIKFGTFQKRNIDEYVYNYFVMLALEYKFHALLAIQSNRVGGKINRGEKGQDDRLLVMEDVNESYGAMQIATNVITINRDPWCEENDFVIFYISKSRSADKGWAVVCKSNFGHAITHAENLGCTYYKGNVPLGAQVEFLFRKNFNQVIPNKAAHLAMKGETAV